MSESIEELLKSGQTLLNKITTHGAISEPLRVAHLLAKAIFTG